MSPVDIHSFQVLVAGLMLTLIKKRFYFSVVDAGIRAMDRQSFTRSPHMLGQLK